MRKGNAEPAIKDFSLTTFYGNDTTQALLQQDVAQLYLFLKDGYKAGEWTDELEAILTFADKKNIEGFLITNLPIDELRNNPPKSFTMMTPLKCDVVAMKTAARANPTLMLIRGGTILGKWSYADFRQAFEKISTLQDNPLPQLAPEEQSAEPADSTNQ